MQDVEQQEEVSLVATKKQNGGWKIAAFGVIATVGVVALAGHGPIDTGLEEHLPRFLVSDTKIFQLSKNSRVKYSTLSGHHQRKLFAQFQEDWGKEYKGVQEEKARLKHFKDTLVLIDKRNAAEVEAGTDGLHGITKFADLSQSEFEEAYLGTFKMIQEKNLIDSGAVAGEIKVFSKSETSAQDWTGKYVTSVNDQGECASSWAFSAVEQIESDAMRAGIIQRSETQAKLSYQQAISCNTENGQMACGGGYQWYTYDFVATSGGIAYQSNYPYTSGSTGQMETCNTQSTIEAVVSVTQGRYFYNQESTMQDYVLSTGPLAASVSARSWNTYVSGTMSTAVCEGWDDYEAWHSVQITGVDLGNGRWKVRNSWGADWGEDGYIYLQTDATATTNTCGIASFATYADVAAPAKVNNMKSSKKSSTKKSSGKK